MKSLFGRKKADSNENPYAKQHQQQQQQQHQHQQQQEEYDRMSPYQRARADIAANSPRPNVPGGLPSGPGSRRDYGDSYAGSNHSLGGSTVVSSGQGYGSDRYGSSTGYGMNRFDNNSNALPVNRNAPPARVDGYGGFGRRPSPDYGSKRHEVVGGAEQADAGPNPYDTRFNQPGNRTPNRYATAGPRQAQEDEDAEDSESADGDLTFDQLEDREVKKIGKKIHREKEAGLASMQRTNAMMDEALEKGSHTLATLGAQEERLNSVEQKLNTSAVHARNAKAKTEELKTLNRSIFAVHVENPFTKKKRLQAHEQVILDQMQADRKEREAVRGEGYREQQRMEAVFNDLQEKRAQVGSQNHGMENTDRYEEEKKRKGKYDIGDEDDEDPETSNLENEAMKKAVILNQMSKEYQRLIEKSNGTIDRISAKVSYKQHQFSAFSAVYFLEEPILTYISRLMASLTTSRMSRPS